MSFGGHLDYLLLATPLWGTFLKLNSVHIGVHFLENNHRKRNSWGQRCAYLYDLSFLNVMPTTP